MEHKADRHQISVLYPGQIHIAWAKQEEVALDTLLQAEWVPREQHLHKNLLWITASNTGPVRPLELPVLTGTLLLTTQTGQPVTTHPPGTRQCGGMGQLGVSRLQELSYHEFLNSHAQEQGVWSRFSNNRWSTLRDRFWSRALPNASVRNSSSYCFPQMWTWQPSLLGTFFGSVLMCHGGHRQVTFAEQFLLRPCKDSRRSTSQNTSRHRLWICFIAILLCHHRGKQLNPDLSICVCKIAHAFPRARGTLYKLNGDSLD